MKESKNKKRGRTRANGTGSIWTEPRSGKIYGVITFTTASGKRKRRARLAHSKTEAYQHIKDMLEELDVERQLEGEERGHRDRKVNFRTITFGQLAQYHKEDHLQPAEFDAAGRKTKGVLSWQGAHRTVAQLVGYFGKDKLVSSFTIGQIRKYKEERLSQPAIARYKKAGSTELVRVELKDAKGKVRKLSFASVHRELAMLRRMLNFAVEERWLPTGNPMHGAKDLINPSLEVKRITIATKAEELELLDHCTTHDKRKHLLPYLMICFDHALRSIEARRMLVRDVDFENNSFMVYSYKGKQRQDRKCAMTARVREALLTCCAGKELDEHVFTYDVKQRDPDGKPIKNADGTDALVRHPLKNAPKRSFQTLKAEAKRWSNGAINLDGFRGHDMRHTQITRLVRSGMSVGEAGKLAGHVNDSTTWRYINPDDSSRVRAASLIENYSEAEIIPFKKRKRA